ncbi:MAG: nucleoside monophosphate kinase [Candidatus Azambacteria bacterium]|nr:nucleoside monophosphate kinase [Candidatus Azambacteria bacterium]
MTVFKKFLAIVILGRPGSGKDTQAELLAKKFGLSHLISSKIIEKSLKSKAKTIKSDDGVYNVEKERRIQKSGYLNTPDFVAALVKGEIKKIAREGFGVVMSGSPRTLKELKEEMPVLEKLYGKSNLYFFHIKINPKEVYVRNLKRHRKDLPELDSRKIIKKRLEVFNRDTFPLIKYLKSQKRVVDVNGEQSIMKIHLDILKSLSPLS